MYTFVWGYEVCMQVCDYSKGQLSSTTLQLIFHTEVFMSLGTYVLARFNWLRFPVNELQVPVDDLHLPDVVIDTCCHT